MCLATDILIFLTLIKRKNFVMKKIIVMTLSVYLYMISNHVSAYVIGHLNDGSQSLASSNLNYYASQHAGASVVGLNNTTFASLSTAQLAAAYDVLVMPWNISSTANFDWATVINPYLQAGGGVLWEDPNNISDLSGAGITFGGTSGYTTIGRTLVSPFDANGAESHFHAHFGITANTSSWNVQCS